MAEDDQDTQLELLWQRIAFLENQLDAARLTILAASGYMTSARLLVAGAISELGGVSAVSPKRAEVLAPMERSLRAVLTEVKDFEGWLVREVETQQCVAAPSPAEPDVLLH